MSDEIEGECVQEPVRLPARRTTTSAASKGTSKARTLTEIRSVARSHTRTAIRVLAGIMRSDDATPAARLAAANAILDRGWGKATQPVENGEDGVLELIHRIERIIVRPGETSGGDVGHDA
ncbi:hypothetical protein [Bradyrhizobium betae]|uniref:Uncharacterized protein n=1 Tax=Bradyrhizobium betae TaxID=244734 RepID=A0A5P6PC65_9BRAD|nr:hypothetical protein [Bradyrhizobium betae]MCS3726501.1 hypothetical protein [Bradyrhizobium betae]QFI75504.1 hypothetical protein F8237_25780 [Bradyrhizobium betae]